MNLIQLLKTSKTKLNLRKNNCYFLSIDDIFRLADANKITIKKLNKDLLKVYKKEQIKIEVYTNIISVLIFPYRLKAKTFYIIYRNNKTNFNKIQRIFNKC